MLSLFLGGRFCFFTQPNPLRRVVADLLIFWCGGHTSVFLRLLKIKNREKEGGGGGRKKRRWGGGGCAAFRQRAQSKNQTTETG